MTSYLGENLSFLAVSLMVLSSGAYAAFSRNIIKAAFSMFFTLFSIAGYYVLLGSDFIAVTQIIIYVGGILVLLVFGVLLTNRIASPIEGSSFLSRMSIMLIALAFIGAIIAPIVFSTPWQISPIAATPNPLSVRHLGLALSGPYIYLFELAGALLLFGLLGAAYLVRRSNSHE